MIEPVLIITKEEGFREFPYFDHLGFPTVGYGRLLGPKDTPLDYYTSTVYEPAEKMWLKCRIEDVQCKLIDSSARNAYLACNEVQKAVMVSMAYQLGVNGLCKFKKTLAFIAAKQFDSAALEMGDSNWANQTPSRYERHADMMQSGKLLEYYQC